VLHFVEGSQLHQRVKLTVSWKQQKPEPRVVINPPAALLRARNAILWGKAKQYHVAEFPGPLSIKTVVRGSALWETREAGRLVDGGKYLILNPGRSYSLTIDSRQIVETFCLFFRQGIAEDVCRVESARPVSLLDNPFTDAIPGSKSAQSSAPLQFLESLHDHDSIVSPLLREIYSRVASDTASDAWLEDQFLAAARALFRVHREGNKRAAEIPAKKPLTRLELYRRLLRGKDYMDSFFEGQVRLGEVAGEACLSPYHFHRLFREVFHQTPNQYLQQKRLANAQQLLTSSEQSVTEICLEVGFESVTSFSTLFRRNFGSSPREYRAKNSEIR
jgi:AraC family transcriptional regulator